MRPLYIVTYYSSANYGSRLQAYALSKYLSRYDYEVTMLKDFKVPSSFLRHPRMLMARVYNKLHWRRRKKFYQPSPYTVNNARQARLDKFLADNFREASFFDSASWKREIRKDPVFVVGSDIVWQPMFGFPSKYYMDFALAEGLPCFAYAPSIGAQDIPRIYRGAIRRFLTSYASVGVREQAAARLLEPIAGIKIERNVDPTLLLLPADWDELAAKAELSVEVDTNGYIFCYFVMDDQRYWDYVAKVAKATGLQVVLLPMHYADEGQPYTVVGDGTPYEFVWLVKHASMVVTDSFHACVFSLQYEREFYLLRRTRADEDDKYDDFLGRYGLAGRVVSAEEEFVRKPDTDYLAAKGALAVDRVKSEEFIRVALEKVSNE